MNKIVSPSTVSGTLVAPASKSYAQRAIAIASLASGQSEIINPGDSDDAQAAIGVSRALGATVIEKKDRLVISGGLKTPTTPLDCGESGLSVRMFSAIASLLEEEVVLTGKGSLLNRPMSIIEDSLTSLGVKCKTTFGKLPIKVKGPYNGGIAKIDGKVSSQVVTGILIASPCTNKEVTLFVEKLQSQPYIDITIDLMRTFGVEVQNFDYKKFTIKSGQRYKPFSYTVESDWSGAAFLMVAGAVGGMVEVKGLKPSSYQADKAVVDVLRSAGAFVSVDTDSIGVYRKNLIGFEFDATHCPDLFPPLVALASHCKGVSKVRGVSRLRVKESDRAATLIEEFGKLGVQISVEGEVMIIKGGKPTGGIVDSHGDHRIAMALAVAALAGRGEVEIQGAEAVAKSYPGFFDDLARIVN